MPASLLSPNFKAASPTLGDVKFASVVWGLTMGLGILTAWKAVEQMIPIWRRNRCTKSMYIWMVWALWLDNTVFSIICWAFMDGIFKPSFLLFFSIICTWTIQTQLILQIIINRSALIMVNPQKAVRLKWTIAAIVFLINISVFCIWIPARLQISPRFIAINQVWDRVEKVLFLFLDAGLNGYFLYLVKARLISQGLDKYTPLFKFNSAIVVVSVSMDILLICMMDLHNSFSYIAFHPLVYMVKLYIELVMTDLIIKVTRKSQALGYSSHESTNGKTTKLASKRQMRVWPTNRNEDEQAGEERSYTAHISSQRQSPRLVADGSIMGRGSVLSHSGIKKTVFMEQKEEIDQVCAISMSSMEELNIEVSRYSGGGSLS